MRAEKGKSVFLYSTVGRAAYLWIISAMPFHRDDPLDQRLGVSQHVGSILHLTVSMGMLTANRRAHGWTLSKISAFAKHARLVSHGSGDGVSPFETQPTSARDFAYFFQLQT